MGDTAQVGPQLAEKLGLPQITYFEQVIELSNKTLRARRNVGSGWEVLEARLPVLLTVLDTAIRPRPAAARRTLRFKHARCADEIRREIAAEMPDAPEPKRETELSRRIEQLREHGLCIDQWNLDDIKADLEWCGLEGSPTKVHRVQSIVLTKEGFSELPPSEEGIRQMIHELIVDHTLG
jgi:electron transfer flavoprotein beta subunit